MTVSDFNNAINLYSDGIYRFALKHIRVKTYAEDIVQDTFTKVWIKHEEVSSEKIKSYLFTTAYHAIVDFIKKEKRNGDIENTVEKGGTTPIAEFDLQAQLSNALNTLPEIQKTVVLLRDYEGYNYAEIADITQLTEAQVKVYIFRARQSLKNYIKEIDVLV
jgi:RNA polymerase sigma factor (sigma-70 family)